MSQDLSVRYLSHLPTRVQDLVGFSPKIVDGSYLRKIGIDIVPDGVTLAGLIRGSKALVDRLKVGNLIPRSRISLVKGILPKALEIHNYTGACPTLTFEINPVRGCHVGCLYCLVSDGDHTRELELFVDYPSLVESVLEQRYRERHYFYFSPKTEALQEPTLQAGVTHEILRVFIRHYERHPDSLARLFFASKGGIHQVEARHDGESVLDLFKHLQNRMQFNTSVSIIPEWLRCILEPHAPTFEERLEAVRACQRHGVMANAALVQPILTPWLHPVYLDEFFSSLAASGIISFKPELLTVDPACLAVIGQIVGHFDKRKEKELYEAYISPTNFDHKKQHDRTAPERARSMVAFQQLIEAGERHGMAASICFWVRSTLGISEEMIPGINRHGFQCLGYQTRLFEQPATSATP